MFRLYKWLVYIFIKPYKKFQHFIKCLAIFNSMAKQMSEETEKKNRKERGKILPGAQAMAQTAQPIRAALSSSLGTSTQLRARHAAPVAVASPQPSRAPSRSQGELLWGY